MWEPDEYLIDDSWIPRESLPVIAGNYIRATRDAQREAKGYYLRAEKAERERDDLQALLIELKPEESR